MKPSTRLAVVALAVGIAFAGGAGAQNASDKKDAAEQADAQRISPNPEQQLEHLTKHLQLTPDQVEKVGPILENRRDALESLRNDSSIKGPDRHTQMQTIVEDSDQQVEAVLTDSQRQQYEQMRDKATQRPKGKHPQADTDGTN